MALRRQRSDRYTRWNNFLFLYGTATCMLNLSITDTFGMKVNALICKYTVEPQIKPNAVISKVSLIQGQNTTCIYIDVFTCTLCESITDDDVIL